MSILFGSQRFLGGTKVSDVADLPKYFPIDNRLPCNHPPPLLVAGYVLRSCGDVCFARFDRFFFPTLLSLPCIYEILHTHTHTHTRTPCLSTLVPNA